MQAIISSSSQSLHLSLCQSETMKLPLHMMLKVKSGKLWLTQANQSRDEILGPGAKVHVESDSVLIEAIQSAQFELEACKRPTTFLQRLTSTMKNWIK